MAEDLEQWAIKGIEQELEGVREQRVKLDEREEALKNALSALKGQSSAPKGRTYTISEEGRKRISEAQKARWAAKTKRKKAK